MRWLAVLALGLSLGGTAGPAQERLAVTRADGAKVAILDFRPEGADCPPLLILSHGAGGTEQALAWLARDAMRAGFRAITIAHAESGRAQLRKVLRSPDRRAALVALVTDRQVNAARMRDLEAVWSYATRGVPARLRGAGRAFDGGTDGNDRGGGEIHARGDGEEPL